MEQKLATSSPESDKADASPGGIKLESTTFAGSKTQQLSMSETAPTSAVDTVGQTLSDNATSATSSPSVPTLPPLVPRASCHPPRMTLKASCEPSMMLPPGRAVRPVSHEACDDDDDIYAACEPSLMTRLSSDVHSVAYKPTAELELSPLMSLMSCDPSQMMPAIDLEEMVERKTVDVTHAARLEFLERLPVAEDSSRFRPRAASAPALLEPDEYSSEASGNEMQFKVRRTISTPLPCPPSTDYSDNITEKPHTQHFQPQCLRRSIAKLFDRFFGLLDILLVLVFGIGLYVVDVGSDIMASVIYFREGHLAWGSLTVSIVVLSAVSWAAVSWTWWYYDQRQEHRRTRMLLAFLLLDPLVR